MKHLTLLTTFFIVLIALTAFAEENDDGILGEWKTSGGSSIVEIYKCGEMYCGKISWLKKPYYEDGTAKIDKNNPEESKKDRKILGMDIVWDFKYKGKNKWYGGKIYDPDNGKTYSCNMTLHGNELKVRGYIGFSFIGRTTVWTRKI
jgi:uncharacterized protein (DUF2147 family)